MSEQHVNDTTYRDPLDSFTDREETLALFEQFLDAAQPGQISFLAIKGNSGIGKSFLISYLTQHVCSKRGWQTGQISFSQTSAPNFRSILAGLEDGLKGCIPRESLKQYRDKRDEYIRRFDEYRASITINQINDASEESIISDVTQNVQVNVQLRERELQLRYELSRALIELTEESQHPFCLFLDGYERLIETDTELVGWLLSEILPALAKASSYAVRVMICGWQWPNDAAIAAVIHPVELADFERAQVRKYLEKQAVISSITEPLKTEEEDLVNAFYELTKGHPLALGLAVTFFKHLGDSERNAAILRSKRLLVNEQARVQFLQERLLLRLPEPYRTLLERGPILRYFDQQVLQILLNIGTSNGVSAMNELADRTYDQFLAYPFISRESTTDNELLQYRSTFHDLVRRVQLEALRNHLETKEQLHRVIAEFYGKKVEAERERRAGQEAVDSKYASRNASSTSIYAEWLAEIPATEFNAILEELYHRFQVRDFQADAWQEWEKLTGQAVNRWRRRQAGMLLELLDQLVEEGEPYFGKTSNSYGQYLIWYARFIEQEARWEEAQNKLEEAAKVFEQVGDSAGIATSLNDIGLIYRTQGKLEQAREYYERALKLREQVGDPADIATSLNGIGVIYRKVGKLKQAREYYERALALREQVGDPITIAISLNNIGFIYSKEGKLEQALEYYERALELKEQVGNPADTATSLNNIGFIYRTQGKLEQALEYYERALALREQVGNPTSIATSLNNIGFIYRTQGKLEQAIKHYARALNLFESLGQGFESNVADELEHLASCYAQLGEHQRSFTYNKRAQDIRKKVQKHL